MKSFLFGLVIGVLIPISVIYRRKVVELIKKIVNKVKELISKFKKK